MRTLRVQDVPERLYEWLCARARQNGRSLDAEMLAILEEAVARDAESAVITARLAELADRIGLPADAPRPEGIIRLERFRRWR